MTGFAGFEKATLDFLRGLGANNEKPWFDAHRGDYEAHFVVPAKAFVSAVAGPLAELAPEVNAEPRINGSIFRINRDIRFSKDKRPYKDHLDLWFWEGHRKGAVSGFFFRLTAERLILGAGAHLFDKDRLAAYRQAVVDPVKGEALRRALDELAASGHGVQGQHYAKLPRGFEAETEDQARLLRHKALWPAIEEAHPTALSSAELVPYCAAKWREVAPLHRWLVDTLS